MSTTIAENFFLEPVTEQGSVIASGLSIPNSAFTSAVLGDRSIPFSGPTTQSYLQVKIPNFSFELSAPIKEIMGKPESPQVIIKVVISENVIGTLSLRGRLVEDEAYLNIEQVLFRAEPAQQKTRPVFIASTLMAMLPLAKEVELKIPQFNWMVKLNIDLPLKMISQMLKRRQIAYRLMVIEQATGLAFSLPPYFTADQIETINYVFNAITNRSFIWPTHAVGINLPASEESLTRLKTMSQSPDDYYLGPQPTEKEVLGQRIELGNGTILLKDAIMENANEVIDKVARKDGQMVRAMLRSLSGQALHIFEDSPKVTNNPWNKFIQNLISLEPLMNSHLAERYNTLAAATLADLTDEEKAIVTAETEFDDNVL